MSLNIVNKTTGALSQVAGNADDSGIGNLNSLTTTDKSSLVNAVNEVNSGLTDVNNNILSLVSIETHTTNSDTASANGGRLGLTCSTARVGYTALGIVGVTIINDQSIVENGVCLGLAFIDGSGNVQISARNYTSNSITAFAKVDIIYIKNS